MPLKTANRPDEILGYELKERLGAGGYGEVWRAEAPGGIAKAVKLVYGYHDENRATRELRALNRVKQLRHPFLLSLDRIDVVQGQLVIVTEMADCCLKDRFDECREKGLPGIPRDELLQYLRDAADALDFMGLKHSLQHLDIKPENLLLVGSHVKVADFGLVKEITDASQSLMGGLTPAYSPPELFDGRPCHASDQYSLAIVYQEMLTGERPFPGTTAAQLASQHMNVRPQIAALARGDQAVVAKALSKDPSRRYANCVDFVSELSDRQINQSATGSFDGSGSRRSPAVRQKSPSGGSTIRRTTSEIAPSLLPTKRSQVVVTKMPPAIVDPDQAKQRPILLIGVGHTGVMVMRELRREIRMQWAGDRCLPAVRVLCIDSDEKDLAKTTFDRPSDSLRLEDTLAIPLRRPEEYRKSDTNFGWISRRWLYNIPRSLQTEGMRPLGRLAFVDHHAAILAKLHEAIEDITGDGNLEETARNTGLNYQENSPQVYIVASTAGGIGSGCVLDVAYAVRTVLLEHGIDDGQVMGVLVHASRSASTDRDLSTANTYACLSELLHYARAEGYPGDESCGLPAFGTDQQPFSDTYFIDLGHSLLQDEYENATRSIAHYLLLSTLTPSATFFDQCRQANDGHEEMTVRAFGTSSGLPPGYRRTKNDLPHDLLTLQLCDHLLSLWDGDSDEASLEVVPDEFAKARCAEAGIDYDHMICRGNQLVLDTLGCDIYDRLETTAQTVLSDRRKLSSPRVREILIADIKIAMDQVLGKSNAADGHGPIPLAAVRSEAADRFSPVRTAIESLVDQPAARMGAALRAGDACRRKLQDYVDQLDASIAEVDQAMAAADERISGKLAESKRAKVAAACGNYATTCAELRFRRLGLVASKTLVHEIASLFQDFARQQDAMVRRVKRFTKSCRTSCRETLSCEEEPTGGERDVDCAEVKQQRVSLVRHLDQLMQQNITEEFAGLANLVDQAKTRESFSQSLVSSARQLVTQSRRQVDLDPSAKDSSAESPKTIGWLRTQLDLAQPSGLRYSGAVRLLLASPERCPTDDFVQVLQSEFGEQATAVPSTGGELTVCYEMADIRLTDVALSLLENRPDCASLVGRLHSRNDIQWSPLTGRL